jgi:hypothetical protein
MFVNSMLRGIFLPKGDEVTRGRKKQRTAE